MSDKEKTILKDALKGGELSGEELEQVAGGCDSCTTCQTCSSCVTGQKPPLEE